MLKKGKDQKKCAEKKRVRMGWIEREKNSLIFISL